MHNYNIHHGDVFDFIKTIKDNEIQLIITSPPYNIGKSYENKKSLDQYLQEQETIIKECHRTLSDIGSICWQVGNFVDKGEVVPLDIVFYPIFKKIGFKLRNRIIWHFEHGLHCTKRLSGRYETILWFTKTDHYIFNLDPIRIPSKYPNKKHFKGKNKGKLSCNPLGKNPSDVWKVLENDWENLIWDIPNVKCNHPEKTIHPCQFPVEIVERCILALTNEGDKVFDPYVGSGTTMIAALNRKRIGIGCEKEEKYVKIAKNRIEDYLQGNVKIRDLGKPIYQPK